MFEEANSNLDDQVNTATQNTQPRDGTGSQGDTNSNDSFEDYTLSQIDREVRKLKQ